MVVECFELNVVITKRQQSVVVLYDVRCHVVAKSLLREPAIQKECSTMCSGGVLRTTVQVQVQYCTSKYEECFSTLSASSAAMRNDILISSTSTVDRKLSRASYKYNTM
jgi:hypothetical protein